MGSAANRIRLDRDGVEGGDRWVLLHDVTSTISVEYVGLQDGEAQGPGLAAAMNSVDLGNNLNWYFGAVSEADAPPLRLALEAAPNPFNPTTTLRYEIPRAGGRVYPNLRRHGQARALARFGVSRAGTLSGELGRPE